MAVNGEVLTIKEIFPAKIDHKDKPHASNLIEWALKKLGYAAMPKKIYYVCICEVVTKTKLGHLLSEDLKEVKGNDHNTVKTTAKEDRNPLY